jgi:hypothetical protein
MREITFLIIYKTSVENRKFMWRWPPRFYCVYYSKICKEYINNLKGYSSTGGYMANTGRLFYKTTFIDRKGAWTASGIIKKWHFIEYISMFGKFTMLLRCQKVSLFKLHWYNYDVLHTIIFQVLWLRITGYKINNLLAAWVINTHFIFAQIYFLSNKPHYCLICRQSFIIWGIYM